MDRKQYRLLFSAACLGLMLFGFTITMIGSIMPEIMPRYGISRSEAGMLFMFLNFGILMGSFIFGPIADRYGYKALLIICSVMILIGIEGVAFSPTFSLLSLFILLFGVGGGIMNGATNALVSDISGTDRSAGLTFLAAFFGLGAFGVPLILGLLLHLFSYTAIVSSLGIIVIAAIVFFLLLDFPEAKFKDKFPVKKALLMLKEPTLLLLAVILFLQSGMENVMGGWSASYLNEILNVEPSRSVLLLSFFWLGMMVSRLLISKLLKRVSVAFVLKASVGVAMLGIVSLLLSGSVALSTASLFVIGMGFGSCFPLVLGFIGGLYPDMSGTAFSIAFSIALLGGMSMPYITGIFSDLFGIEQAFLIIPISLMLFFGLISVVLRRLSLQHANV
ncbi:MAG: MFS transporter [Balneolaceae bacterium]